MKHPFSLLLFPLFVAFLLLMDHETYADIYKYVDDQGRIHYANSPEAVPQKYRQQVEFEPEIKASGPAPSLPAVAPSAPGNGGNAEDDLGDSKAAALKAREQALQKELETFRAEQAELGRMREEAGTASEVNEYHRKMELFQERFDAFHEKRRTFEKDALEYNEKVRQAIEQTLKELEAKEK